MECHKGTKNAPYFLRLVGKPRNLFTALKTEASLILKDLAINKLRAELWLSAWYDVGTLHNALEYISIFALSK